MNKWGILAIYPTSGKEEHHLIQNFRLCQFPNSASARKDLKILFFLKKCEKWCHFLRREISISLVFKTSRCLWLISCQQCWLDIRPSLSDFSFRFFLQLGMTSTTGQLTNQIATGIRCVNPQLPGYVGWQDGISGVPINSPWIHVYHLERIDGSWFIMAPKRKIDTHRTWEWRAAPSIFTTM